MLSLTKVKSTSNTICPRCGAMALATCKEKAIPIFPWGDVERWQDVWCPECGYHEKGGLEIIMVEVAFVFGGLFCLILIFGAGFLYALLSPEEDQ